MRELPAQKLDPKVKMVWRINDFIWITLAWIVCAGTVFLISLDPVAAPVAHILEIVFTAIWVIMLIIWLGILPPIRYVRWRYELNEDYLDIAKGIIWRKRYVIPFIRVQNTDTRQGPILRLFGLATTTVSDAAGEHSIPGLDLDTAEALRDKAAELARVAREDV